MTNSDHALHRTTFVTLVASFLPKMPFFAFWWSLFRCQKAICERFWQTLTVMQLLICERGRPPPHQGRRCCVAAAASRPDTRLEYFAEISEFDVAAAGDNDSRPCRLQELSRAADAICSGWRPALRCAPSQALHRPRVALIVHRCSAQRPARPRVRPIRYRAAWGSSLMWPARSRACSIDAFDRRWRRQVLTRHCPVLARLAPAPLQASDRSRMAPVRLRP